MRTITKIFIFSDILLLSSAGLIGPIFAIFIDDHLIGGGALAAGMAMMVFLLVSGVGDLIMGRYIDKIENPKLFLIIGSLIIAIVPIAFIFITNVNQLYALEAVAGIGAALSYPIWYMMFSNNLDQKHDGYAWSIYEFCTRISMAITAFLGGWVAQNFGFKETFIIVGVLGIMGAVTLIFIKIPEKKNKRKIKRKKIRLTKY
ncbi:MAG: MFS transporter [Nanoarchaeota archaeon]|nr:MFS transporter [Nanoarchaeota archaeon]